MPEFLYKYLPINGNSITNLINRRLWFSKTARFNDPFDSNINPKIEPSDYNDFEREALNVLYRGDSRVKSHIDEKYGGDISQALNNSQARQALREMAITMAEDIYTDTLNKFRAKSGICCFGGEKDNILMWSHYSDGHKGMCLEFDKSIRPFSMALRVNYSNDYPDFDIRELYSDEYIRRLFDRIILAKSIYWSYEKEWRIIETDRGDFNKRYRMNALKGVYLGLKVSEEVKEAIIEILSKHYNNSARLYIMKKIKNKFELIPEEIEY